MRKRGELDGINELEIFADKLEKATIGTIRDGVMSGDLAALCTIPGKQVVGTEEFMAAIGRHLDELMA